MRKKTVTFSDIARYTGFSKNTISRYFNYPDTITEKNRKIISDALDALGYQENKVARILANGKTEFIGVIVPNLNLHFYSELLSRLLELYGNYRYKFLVFSGNENYETERQYILELLAYKIEGMIILSHTIPSKELASYNIPIVSVEREDEFISSVNTDNISGGRDAARLLSENGCDILIHINSKVTPCTPAYGRISGFRGYCDDNGIEKEIIQIGWTDSFTKNKRILEDILCRLEEKYKGRRKGIFVSNDNNAACLLNIVCRKYGNLPDDIRIVGFDNSIASAEAIIPISTIGQQLDVIAKNVMELLKIQIEAHRNGESAPALEHRKIPVVAVKRETA